jgi:hypothetical protein
MHADIYVLLEDNYNVIIRVLEDITYTFTREFVYTLALLFP